MADPTIEKYAELLVDYCLEDVDFGGAWRNGQKRLLLSYDSPLGEELARAVVEKVYSKGGDCLIRPRTPWAEYTRLSKAPDQVLDAKDGFLEDQLKYVAAFLSIVAPVNTRSLASVNRTRASRASNASHWYINRLYETDNAGKQLMATCLTSFPTPAVSQDAGMSFPDYQKWAFEAMYLDGENPADAWRQVSPKQWRIIDEHLRHAHKLKIIDKSNGTDLSMHIRDHIRSHRWIISDGHRNMPSDETYNAPIVRSVEGTLNLTELPQYFNNGPEVRGISLRFEEGIPVFWHAETGLDYLSHFLKSTRGADMLGEIGIGMHPKIQSITKQILYDEKIGGTVHAAFGSAYPFHVIGDGDRSGLNVSPVHWDLIKDMRHKDAYIELDGPEKGIIRLFWDANTGLWVPESS